MSTVKNNLTMLHSIKGTDIEKIKGFLEANLDDWFLEDQSLVIDLLDDKSLVAEDLLEALRGIAEFDSENRAFNNAVVAIDLFLKEEHRKHLAKAPVKVDDEFSYDSDSQSNDDFSADHFEEGLRSIG